MQELAADGDPKGAATVYENLSKRLFDDFGIRPNEQTRSVYRAAAHSPEDRTLPMEEVLQHIQEPQGNAGAMQCDYDYFKVLCYAESRAMERNGNATHIALLSLASISDKMLTKRSMDRIMEQLGEQLRGNLRRGDTISRCSVSQYIIMLPKANYENSCMVCRRVITAFHRAHPHVSAKINFMVQPLTPNICVP
jgi:GGDEF domain-containing protein